MILSLLGLSLKSFRSRKLVIGLSVFSLSISILLVLSLVRLESQTKKNFENSLSGTDLLVGARTSPVQLLLYSIFHLGRPISNVSWESFQKFKSHEEVEWAVPLSMGDSHRNHRVVGTTKDFFQFYKYGEKQKLDFEDGKIFNSPLEVVLGSSVANKFNYSVGDRLVLVHGFSEESFYDHSDHPFKVNGILEATGTPVDRALFVSLSALELIHQGWEDGSPPEESLETQQRLSQIRGKSPESITSFLVGLKETMSIFYIQREINEYSKEALVAVIPAMAFHRLWKILAPFENAFLLVSFLVFILSLIGTLAVILINLEFRKREIAILRSLGASRYHIFGLLLIESFLIGALACGAGLLFFEALRYSGNSLLLENFGISFGGPLLYWKEIGILLAFLASSLLIGLLPAIQAYRRSLSVKLAQWL